MPTVIAHDLLDEAGYHRLLWSIARREGTLRLKPEDLQEYDQNESAIIVERNTETDELIITTTTA